MEGANYMLWGDRTHIVSAAEGVLVLQKQYTFIEADTGHLIHQPLDS